ncbi:MAG: oligopeptide/dipeptide ABC transporter ATP-binding protein [Clostridiaceae bacterium]|nr:oligopeptide/dipeptide ABC transporter ATP-binding protein [Clostridiaceae bacterium]
MMTEPLISARNIKKYFDVAGGKLKAVDGISFDIYPGETFGLVGESGCGKSTVGRTILRLYEPTEGEVIFNGKNIYELSGKEMREVRGDLRMIFQDSYASLDPRMRLEDIVAEPFDIHKIYKSKAERTGRVVELLKLVGLNEEHAMRFPHELSGGQRQRIGIARALALNPKFIVCDEPVSALDLSIQAQVVNLLKELQERLGLTYMFIAHDLSMVRYISDRAAVMYLGHIVELAKSEELYSDPVHPYTRALLSAIPIPDPGIQRNRKRIMLEGDVPSPVNLEDGCRFAGRCPYAMDKCRKETPVFEEKSENHFAACHIVHTR